MEHSNNDNRLSQSLPSLCHLEGLEVRAGDRPILAGIDLEVKSTGLFAVMGPVGVGKSTLLAVLDGHGNNNGLSYSYAKATYAGGPLGIDNHPIVIEQASRSEQAQRAINGGTIRSQIKDALAKNPEMLCLDEPTAGVAHSEALSLLNSLKEESKKRAIIMVTHNSEQARFFADWVVLLGGGEIVEQGPAEAFFDKPSNPATKHFIKTGSLALPRLDAHPRHLAPENRGLPEGINAKTVGASDGILNWIIRRSFAIVRADTSSKTACASFVQELKSRSIDAALVSTSSAHLVASDLKAAEIDMIQFEYGNPDGPREIRASLGLAEQISAKISRGHRVAVLENGSERAGILAAVQLIHMGITAKDAVDLLNVKAAGVGINVHDEQFLWDLELVLDLSADNDQPSSDDVNDITLTDNNPVRLVKGKGSAS